jgi:hypothetical protein
MDPHRNPGLNNGKLQAILQSQNSSPRTTSDTDEMPAPPAYHSVVDRDQRLVSSAHHPCDPEEQDKDDSEIPDISVNATTQVRGNGNIISMAIMDSGRIANLIAALIYGEQPPSPLAPGQTLPSLASRFNPGLKPLQEYPKFNISVNCGVTIIGDRNIVGPGLGDIARQMQQAQRNQALQAQQQATAAAAAATAQNQHRSPAASTGETLYPAQATMSQQSQGLFGMHGPTPPMSRSPSLQSEGSCGMKRKAEDGAGERGAKRKTETAGDDGGVKRRR